jgi:predicted dehydrogenase
MTTAAVIGCGDVSIVHFAALASLPEVQLVAVCDTDPERLTAAVADYDVCGSSNASINRPIQKPQPPSPVKS